MVKATAVALASISGVFACSGRRRSQLLRSRINREGITHVHKVGFIL
jgi:hypothetical protein